MSASRKGPQNPMYGRYGKDNPLYGRKATQEHRSKLSAHSQGEGNNAAKLSWKQVDQIRKLLATKQYSQGQIARMFNISRSLVGLIHQNKRWVI